MKIIRGLEHLSYEDRLRGFVQPGEKRAPERPYSSFQYLKETYKRAGEEPFPRACSDRTGVNGLKLKKATFRLDMKYKFFTVRVVRHWNKLTREVTYVQLLRVFKARLDGALSNLV
ncbi:hypothetical protein WISP_127660 [Willisornis vidua]|uniref:Uncharacterized protein n=1 Tax=Willisornis vidua TaxID=1566151 RepID=A0ABQ9CV51_9PASS|nr:hypothetical protein WISP_127660 [Willisornis vidua]